MHQSLHRAMVLVAGLGADRSISYKHAFRQQSARWYHCPVSTFDARYATHVVRELEYLAIAVPPEESSDGSVIRDVWPIRDVRKVPRTCISPEQSGASKEISDDETLYWLFELGNPTRLKQTVIGFPTSGFIDALRVTTLEQLSGVRTHSELTDVYGDAISRTRPAR